MGRLAELDPGSATDEELIDAIVAAERLASFAAAAQAAAIAELAHRRRADPASRWGEYVADEVGAALRLSRAEANRRLSVAMGLDRLPGTASALGQGLIDAPRARAVVEATACLPDALGRAIEDQVLPRAPQQTAPQLRERLRRAVLAADPAAAEARHAAEVAARRVELHQLPDGMAELCALLPAEHAVAIYTALDRHAIAPTRDHRLPIDARRADALVELVTGTATPALGRTLVQVTVPSSTLVGASDSPGELAGYGPIPASTARMLAAGGVWRRLLTDPASGTLLDVGRTTYVPPVGLADYIRARDVTCRHPDCRRPAIYCDLDHTIRHPDGSTSEDNLTAECRHHHMLKHHSDWTVRQDRGGVLVWTSPTGHVYITYPPPIGEPEPDLIPAPPPPDPPTRHDLDTAA